MPDEGRVGAGDVERVLTAPVRRWSPTYKLMLGMLVVIMAVAVYAYFRQFTQGFTVTGMRDVVSWGVYIASFVFFIGISHAGTLVSAVLRVTHAEWRTPVTRMAEVITAVSLLIGASFIIVDLGRPERMLNLFTYGQVHSPLLWDTFGILTYLTGSVVYLYLPMIPDIALLRDKPQGIPRWQRKIYALLAVNWHGTPRQWHHLERALRVMAVIIIPVAVSVHTVVSWVFAMTLRVGWHSTIFAPYFVAGAIYSGTAGIIVAMYFFRRFYHLEPWIKTKHFVYLGYLMVVLGIGMLYFTLSEYLVSNYQAHTIDSEWTNALFYGRFSTLFVPMLIFGFFIPIGLIAIPKTRTIVGITVAGIMANVAMWVERYLIVVATMSTPWTPGQVGDYMPTWVEWSILAGMISLFVFLYALYSGFFPIISIWEVSPRHGPRHARPSPARLAAPRRTAADGGTPSDEEVSRR